jgi:hypothetical protein
LFLRYCKKIYYCKLTVLPVDSGTGEGADARLGDAGARSGGSDGARLGEGADVYGYY